MRCFLALDLPVDAQASIDRYCAGLRSRLGGWRFIPADRIHLTIRFLGATPPDALTALHADLGAVAASTPPIAYVLDGAGTFPARGAPRVLWVGVGEVRPEGSLLRLAGAVEDAVTARGWSRDGRDFHPHVTVARAIRGRRAERPGTSDRPTPVPCTAGELVLYESLLLPGGARYRVCERFPLRAPASGS